MKNKEQWEEAFRKTFPNRVSCIERYEAWMLACEYQQKKLDAAVEALEGAAPWMSACLSDDRACDEIKQDFMRCLEALQKIKELEK